MKILEKPSTKHPIEVNQQSFHYDIQNLRSAQRNAVGKLGTRFTPSVRFFLKEGMSNG